MRIIHFFPTQHDGTRLRLRRSRTRRGARTMGGGGDDKKQRILNVNVGILGHIDSGKTSLGA